MLSVEVKVMAVKVLVNGVTKLIQVHKGRGAEDDHNGVAAEGFALSFKNEQKNLTLAFLLVTKIWRSAVHACMQRPLALKGNWTDSAFKSKGYLGFKPKSRDLTRRGEGARTKEALALGVRAVSQRGSLRVRFSGSFQRFQNSNYGRGTALRLESLRELLGGERETNG